MKGGLTIDTTSGERWELALDLLEAGAAEAVYLGNLELRRNQGSEQSDEKVHFAVLTNSARPSRDTAQMEMADARDRVRAILAKDERFRSIVNRHGEVWEYVHEYDNGGVLLAEVDDEGRLVWDRP